MEMDFEVGLLLCEMLSPGTYLNAEHQPLYGNPSHRGFELKWKITSPLMENILLWLLKVRSIRTDFANRVMPSAVH